VSPGTSVAPLALEPFGATETLRIGSIQDLVPAGELRVIGVGEMLGDDALEQPARLRI
jgi:hypothetical protein